MTTKKTLSKLSALYSASRSPTTDDLAAAAASDLHLVRTAYETAGDALTQARILLNTVDNAKDFAALAKSLQALTSVLVQAREEARETVRALQTVDPPVSDQREDGEPVQALAENFSYQDSDVNKDPTSGDQS